MCLFRVSGPMWSDYRKYLSGQFIRIRLKIEQNCRLFLDNFSGAIMNDLFMTFTSGLKVDAKCVSAVKLDHGGELFWDTPIWLSAWVSVFWAWRMDLNKGVPTLFAYCEKMIWTIVFKFKQGTCPWMVFAWNFSGIFMNFFFWGGSVGQIIYREYIVFRG